MKHEESNLYVAGLLDTCGGFYVVNRKKKKYLYFKIKISNQAMSDTIYNFFTKKLSIPVRNWNGVLNITNTSGIQKLIQFMNTYCLKDDYKRLILKHSFDMEASIQ